MLITCISLAAVSLILALLCFNYRAALSAARAALDAANQRVDDTRDACEKRIADIKAEHAARLNEMRQATAGQFQAIAAEILLSNSKQLDQQNRASVEAVIAPMKSQLEEFAKGFRECYSIESRDRLSMREEIKRLHELSVQVGSEAARLSHALKGNTGVQGRWGEMVLLNILEHSGLEEGYWLVTQDHATDSDGNALRPDAVIHCPGNRDIIIDSKASLKSYFAFLEAETDADRELLMKAHIRSVEKHIRDLRDKDYQSKVGAKKGDFVFMFMPHEGAFLAAMRAKPDLWQDAYDSHVVIASPTHLVTILQLVEQMWKNEKQSVNAQEIARQGTIMLDSLAAFLGELAALGDSIQKAQRNYDAAIHRLQTGNNNVMRVANRLSELGVKPRKPLPLS